MRRFYLLFDNADECRDAVAVLEGAGIGEYRLHAIASLTRRLEGLPGATVWQKTELAKGIVIGALLGALSGFCGGLLAVTFPPPGLELDNTSLLLMTGLGMLFGLLVNALTKSREHNHGLDRFRRDIEAGRILLMTDLPQRRADRLFEQVREKCPGMQLRN